jgi:S-adenosylmethionine:tRNA ribosyltransferase-isomerase
MSYSLDDFDFDLPQSLIAQYPLSSRTDSRLLCLNRVTGDIQHCSFGDFPSFLKANDLLVFNNTKVIPARLFGYKKTGGKVECLIERILSKTRALVHLRASKTPKMGSTIILSHAHVSNDYSYNSNDNVAIVVENKQDDLFLLALPEESTINFFDIVNRYGHMPLPPYIKRDDTSFDQQRYQTVYAKKPGAIAAPTAGLHFDEAILDMMAQKGIASTELTLHVGAGTFQPIRVKDFKTHVMHKEFFEINSKNCDAINTAKERKGRVIAVGTTVVRALETAAQRFNRVQPLTDETQLFIYPSFQFRSTDALLTNFHLPKSTLLMLVSAFAGYDLTLQAYRTAVEKKYRFFSYGDAMFIYDNPIHL